MIDIAPVKRKAETEARGNGDAKRSKVRDHSEIFGTALET
jgi:hypothetical protein